MFINRNRQKEENAKKEKIPAGRRHAQSGQVPVLGGHARILQQRTAEAGTSRPTPEVLGLL